MKKLLTVLTILALVWCGSVFAGPEEPINTTISTDKTPIALDGDTQCRVYTFQARDAVDFKWYKTATSTKYFTVKSGTAITVTNNRETTPTNLFWAQAESGTPVIEVFIHNFN